MLTYLDQLDAIESRQYDVSRNKVEVFKRYKDKTEPSWTGIADAVEKLGKIVLAEALRNKYVYSQPVPTITADQHDQEVALAQTQPNVLLSIAACTSSPATSKSSPTLPSQRTSPIIVAKIAVKEFRTINAKFGKLVADIKDAICREASIHVAHLQYFLKTNCKLQPLESATMEIVLNRMDEHYSLYEHDLLQDIVENYLPQLRQKLDNFEEDLQRFKSSTVLTDLEGKITEKSKLTNGTQIEIKLNQSWREVYNFLKLSMKTIMVVILKS